MGFSAKIGNRRLKKRSGQAAIEFPLLYVGILLPLTFGVIFAAEMFWVWHSMVEFTRDGARYAATHCWQSDASNVTTYMQSHVPLTVDIDQFQNGQAALNVLYYQRDPTSGSLTPFTCDGDCTVNCVPDVVTVGIGNYQFRHFVGFLKLPPVSMPEFLTSAPIESNGCDPEQTVCIP